MQQRTTRRGILACMLAMLAPSSLLAQTPPSSGTRRLAVLSGRRADDPEMKTFEATVRDTLVALGWRDGGDLRIEWRYCGGDSTLFDRYAAELVALAPDVILAPGSPSVATLQRQKTVIPIVFLIVTDPVGQGFVKSLAHPGGTVTGFSDFDAPMAGKWLELLSQLAPPVAHVMLLYNPATSPAPAMLLRSVEDAAQHLAMTVRAAPVHDDAEIEAMMADLSREDRGGLLVLPDSFTLVHRSAILAGTARYRLPAVYWNHTFVIEGGLMSYSTDNNDAFRRAAGYADRIFKGARPAELPVQAPTKF